MLPMLQSEVVEKKRWATDDELLDYFAVGQCTPGVIAVNTASFIGYYKKRNSGSDRGDGRRHRAQSYHHFAHRFFADKLCELPRYPACALRDPHRGLRFDFQAVIKMFRSGVKDGFGILVFGAALVCSYFSVLPTIVIVLMAGVCGVLMQLWNTKKAVKK